MLDQFAKDVVSKFAKVKTCATPHKTIFAVAKAKGLRVAIDGEFEEAREEWDLLDEGVDEDIRVDVYKDTTRLGSIKLLWSDESTLEVIPLKAKA